jgi:hypothetical protein
MGDIRCAFNPHSINDDAFVGLSAAHKHAVYLNYIGCRNALSKRFPNALPQSSANENRAPDPFLYEKIINEVAGAKFGTTDEVEHKQLYQVMLYIDGVIENAPKAT